MRPTMLWFAIWCGHWLPPDCHNGWLLILIKSAVIQPHVLELNVDMYCHWIYLPWSSMEDRTLQLQLEEPLVLPLFWVQRRTDSKHPLKMAKNTQQRCVHATGSIPSCTRMTLKHHSDIQSPMQVNQRKTQVLIGYILLQLAASLSNTIC